MNYKNFKRCVNAPKYFRFVLPLTAAMCFSYEEFDTKITELFHRHIVVVQEAKSELEKKHRAGFISELDYVKSVVERLKSV